MEDGANLHVSVRFARLLDLYRKPDGSKWGGKDLQRATGGAVTRSYVANLKGGRISSPGLDKLAAISGAMGFPPELWFGDEGGFEDEALLAALRNPTVRTILEEALKLGKRDRELLLGVVVGMQMRHEDGKPPLPRPRDPRP